MKRFLVKVAGFSIVLVLIGQVGGYFLDPYYGDDSYYTKHWLFQQHKDQYNTVFLGSSRLYRHVNPRLLDSSVTKTHSKSINLACPGTFNPEVYYLYERLLQENTGNLKFAFLELQPLNEITITNIATSKNLYWFNVRNLKYSLAYLYEANYPYKIKIALTARYLISYGLSLVNFTKFGFIQGHDHKLSALGNQKDGFCSLNDEPDQIRRLIRFQADTSALQNRISIANKAFRKVDHRQHLNKIHLARLQELIDRSKAQGISLRFIIAPRLTKYDEVLALKEALPPDQVIELADYSKYSDLYRAANSFDVGHLNKRGADLFTIQLAKQIDATLGKE